MFAISETNAIICVTVVLVAFLKTQVPTLVLINISFSGHVNSTPLHDVIKMAPPWSREFHAFIFLLLSNFWIWKHRSVIGFR